MAGLKLISNAVPRVTAKTFSRKYIALGRIVEHWPEIIGRDMASRAQPVKLHFRKPKDKKSRATASLDIAANSAECSLLQYQKDCIKERINHIFGDEWITDIRFVHAQINNASQKKPHRIERPFHTEDQKNLKQMLENIGDPDIKERLMSFGTAFFKNQPDKQDTQ